LVYNLFSHDFDGAKLRTFIDGVWLFHAATSRCGLGCESLAVCPLRVGSSPPGVQAPDPDRNDYLASKWLVLIHPLVSAKQEA